MAAISYDSPEVLARFGRERGITYPLLSDTGSATIDAYGIRNTVADEVLGAGRDDATVQAEARKFISVTGSIRTAELARGTPFPGTFVVDRDGRVVSRHFEEFYRERVTASSVSLLLGGRTAPVTATRVATDHLELTAYLTDAEVAPGARFSLVVEVVPRTGIHVYAPGANGYRSVQVGVDPLPHVRTLPVRYPPSEIYFFAPLNERVPVYQQPFTLVQDLVLEASPEAERALRNTAALIVAGTFEYQACDDTVCFNPKSVPLSWHLAIGRHP